MSKNKNNNSKNPSPIITTNRQANHDFFIDEQYQAGLVLSGWEVKSIRAGHVHLKESYVTIKDGELFIFGMHITPLNCASTHDYHDPIRTRKLLLQRREINRLIGKVERAGFTLIPLNLHFCKGRIKAQIALAKGKKLYDKRKDIAERDWKRDNERLIKSLTR